jgi:hypothetical protein
MAPPPPDGIRPWWIWFGSAVETHFFLCDDTLAMISRTILRMPRNGSFLCRILLFLAVSGLVALAAAPAAEISRAFEIRYVTADARADGETDFKGATSIFTTEQRLEFLSQYEKFAGRFFGDANWDTRVVTDADVRQALGRIKPQPLPEVRRRLPLTAWKFLGSRPGQREEKERSLAAWREQQGAQVEAGELVLQGSFPGFEHTFAPQDWRFRFQCRVLVPSATQRTTLSFGDVIAVGLGHDGRYFYLDGSRKRVSVGAYQPGQWHELTIEADLETGRFSFFADGVLLADFVPMLSQQPVAKLAVHGPIGVRIDDLWGTGYTKAYDPAGDTHTRDVPFKIRTFLDEDFSVRLDPIGWADLGHDDSAWQSVPVWPYAHGGERHAGETLYLRTKVALGEFDRVELSSECLDPSGEVWINGRPVEVRHDRRPFGIDVTRFLRRNASNVIAVRVDPFEVTRTMRHTSADRHTGWFAGRMWLDLTGRRWIKDVFVRTESLAPDAARVAVSASIRNDHVIHSDEREAKQDNSFKGQVAISFFPWFPAESPTPVSTQKHPVMIQLGRDYVWEGRVAIPHPDLWSPESPHLYRVSVRLEDEQGTPLDDVVVTTGIRTVSQEGGTFRLNGQPAMMNGGLVFGFRPPLHRIAQWLRCPPEENLVRDLLLVKKMNGNTVRMSQHDGPAGGINDPRYAELGDQLGVMFQWGTTSWVRTDSPWQLDFAGLPFYLRQVRNHPSIVMWQPTNHPKFPGGPAEGLVWFKQVYDTIWAEDQSRLIAPVSSLNQIGARNDDGTKDSQGNPVPPTPEWVAPMITRGNMDHATGYGAEWSELRTYPFPAKFDGEQGWRDKGHRTDYLNSPHRAYFDFESEESASQPNWALHRGKPEFQVRSYEIDMDRTSIGRRLTVDEWRLSQAWQAMSGYEAYRKKRWLDYDGMVWCTIDGGGNTATYEKPITDYYGQAKIAFHAIKMAFQPVLAGSKNVDTAYGPGDKIPVAVLNLGPARDVEVSVRVCTIEGQEVARKTYAKVRLPAGRTCTNLPPTHFSLPVERFYAFEYQVTSVP